jgi:DNA-directed RNA polymerase specialized sigma24 family protein
VRAILEVFLGAAHGGVDPHAKAAEDCFERAYSLFSQAESDRWCRPWVRLYEHFLAVARGRDEQALKLARDGLKLATDGVEHADRDFEVEAGLHRAIADVHWRRGDRRRAFRHLARAVFFAYSFTGMPGEPDEYTRTFYRDVRGAALDRILELLPDLDEARRACDAFAEFWKPYWEVAGESPDKRSIDLLLRTNPRDVALCVFPSGPTDDDLEHEGDYTKRVRAVHEKLLGALDDAVESFGTEPFVRRVRGALRFRRSDSVDETLVELPEEPAESPDLFEPSDDPVWPDHWRALPREWRALGDDGAERAAAQAVIDRTVEELPSTWREVLERRDRDGWTYEEVARRLGIARSDQSQMLQHSRARIRAALDAHFAGIGA